MTRPALTLILTSITFIDAGVSWAHRRVSGATSAPYAFEVVDASGRRLPTFAHRGGSYVLGRRGRRYRIRVYNRSARRVEAVVSVDGRDVLDGKAANWRKRGYIVPAYGQVTIDGFRVSLRRVATFRFSKVSSSYAAKMGNAREVGVIGVAIFRERRQPVLASPYRDYGRAAEAESSPARRRSAPAPADSSAGRLQAKRPASRAARQQRSGLGTAFGESRHSQVTQVSFVRAQSNHPSRVLIARYNDRPGLLALGINIDGNRVVRERRLRATAKPFANLRRRSGFATPPPGWND